MKELYFYTGEEKHHFIDVDLLNRPSLYDYLIANNLQFYYLITPTFNVDSYCLEDIFDNIIFHSDILKQIHNNKCIIIMDVSVEPITNAFPINSWLKLIEQFANKYNLSFNNFKVLTGNLIINENLSNIKCEFIPYLFFYDFPQIVIKNNNNGEWKNYIKYNKQITTFNKKILCYNRRARNHRKYLIYKIHENTIIKNNIELSFINDNREIDYTKKIDISKEENDLINRYLNNLPDIKIDNYDYLSVAFKADIETIKSTFVSLITETNVDETILFISEKTFKPIYTCQPFIVLGNVGTLRYLKKFGFKTFDKWWDESYDDEPNLTKRIDKILNVLEFICNKNNDELITILNEMEEILSHNQQLLMQQNHPAFLEQLKENKQILI